MQTEVLLFYVNVCVFRRTIGGSSLRVEGDKVDSAGRRGGSAVSGVQRRGMCRISEKREFVAKLSMVNSRQWGVSNGLWTVGDDKRK